MTDPKRSEAEEYLRDTEPAVRHLFAALTEYDALSHAPSLQSYADASGVILFTREQAMGYMRDLSNSLALDFAKATLCGSVAQVAYMALRQYSRNSAADADWAALSVAPESPAAKSAAKFCVGRRVHGIPMGLLVYAARVQYNHWDEGRPQGAVPKAVFDALLRHYLDDLSFDMAYELNWPEPRPVAHYVLRHELRWMTYDDYIADLRDALGCSPEPPGDEGAQTPP